MFCLNLVDWSSMLSSDSGIPHDVSFKIVPEETATGGDRVFVHHPLDPENGKDDGVLRQDIPVEQDEGVLLHAHKNLLAAVSPVFRTQFYGSLPELSRVIQVKDSTSEAFSLMLGFIYQRSDASSKIENLTEIADIFDVFYLAHKFDVLGFKAKILSRLGSMPVNMLNYEDLTRAVGQYNHFEEACDMVEDSLSKFISQHPNPLELVDVAINNSSVVVKEEVIYKLSSVAESNPLEVLQLAHLLIGSDESKSLDIKKVLRPVMEGCIMGYEAALKFPLLYSKFLPSSSAGYDHELTMIQRAWKENFCKNCESALCKDGDAVDASTVKLGTKVESRVPFMQGNISEVGLSIFHKIRTGGDHGSHSRSEGCTAEAHGDRRWNDGIPTEARRCSGVHKASKPVYRIKLVNGVEIISSEFQNVFFSCK